MPSVIFKSQLPSPQAFKSLRDSADWGEITNTQAREVLAGSLGGICALKNDRLIGMARFIGDGVMNIYIQDVVVQHKHRGQGVGTALVTRLIGQLQQNYPAECTIGLMAAKRQERFYAQFGFITRPSDVYGAGMIAPLGDIRLK